MTLIRLCILVFPALLLPGCAHHYKTPVVYTPVPPPPPTSNAAVPRVYPAPPPAAVAPSGSVSSSDIELAKAISDTLKSNPDLAAATSRVEATVNDGVVTLRGVVPSEHDRLIIIQRVSKLPGVTQVRDQLEERIH